MKKLLTLTALLALFAQGSVLAHSGHSAIDEETARRMASGAVQQMTFTDLGYAVGKLDASWKNTAETDISVIEANEQYYIIRVVNADAKQEAIYLKITRSGELAAVKDENNF